MAKTSTLEVNIEKAPDHVIVRLAGEAAVHDVDELERGLRPIAASRGQLVIMDLAGLRFISSLGLGMLVSLQRGIMAGGGSLRLAGPQQLVRDIIVKCKFDTVLPVYDSIEEARRAHRDESA